MVWLSRVLLALLAALAAGIAVPSPAHACSCATTRTADFVSWADVIVTGTIAGPDAPGPLALASSTVQYDVTVDRVYRGEGIGRDVAVHSEASGAACGWEFIEEGTPYVVFASYRTIDGKPSERLWGSLCGGTQPATPGLVAAVDRLTVPTDATAAVRAEHPAPPDPDVPGPSDPDLPWLVGSGAVIASMLALWLWRRAGRKPRSPRP